MGTTFTWDGGGTNGAWSTPQNWSADNAPPSGSPPDTLVFGGTAGITTNQNDISGLTLSGLQFAAGAGSFILRGNAFSLDSGGVTNGVTSSQKIENPITLSADQTWSGNDTLTLSGTITDGGSTFALVKNGLGTVILSGANSYDGGTTASAGTLQIGSGGTTGSITGNIINNANVTWNRSDMASSPVNSFNSTSPTWAAKGRGG